MLACADGANNIEAAEKLGLSQPTVGKWRQRFVDLRLDGLCDEPRVGRPRSVTDEDVERVVDATLHEKPKASAHWSSRKLARQLELSSSAVGRIWRAFGLRPDRSETFSLSKDPQFVEKVRDVVALYMSPPDKALVLSVDERSQIQALNRMQPLLPLVPTHPERRTNTYARHGATSLFAALDIATGRVIGTTSRRRRSSDFRRFLDEIDAAVPIELDVQLILDNYATHKTPEVQRWLERRPRFHLHFTPTSSSWLNLVESFFSIVDRRVTRRGVHRSTSAVEKDLHAFLEVHNREPKPFIWTKAADQIPDSLKRYCTKANAVRIKRQRRAGGD